MTVATSIALYRDYHAEYQHAERRLDGLAEVTAAHVQQILTSIDLGLRSVDDDPNSPEIDISRPARHLHLLLSRIQSSSSALQGVGIVGPDGTVTASATNPEPPSTNLADRPFFRAHRADASLGLLLSRPVLSRPDNVVAIPVSRRLGGADGSFQGIIAARINPNYFERFFRAIEADHIALYLSDGTLLAQHPDRDLLATPPLREDDAIMRASRDRRAGRVTIDPGADHTFGLASFRRLDAAPVMVVVAYDQSRILRDWSNRRDTVLGLMSVIIALTLAVTLFARRRANDANLIVAANAEARANAEAAAAVAIEARQQALTTDRRKSEFLAHMSHEIRTPLNAIIGFSQMIEGAVLGPVSQPRYRDYAADILFSAQHLLSVINNILDMAKVEAGRWELHEDRLRLDDLIGAVIRLATALAVHERVELAVNRPLPEVAILGDERTLRQILLNLVINAIKFAGADRRVELSAALTTDGGLEIAVIDHGEGMDADEIARALRPFESGSSRQARLRHDTGLGLPLARVFAELHGGTLTLDSAHGRGTAARLRLPAERVVATVAASDS